MPRYTDMHNIHSRLTWFMLSLLGGIGNVTGLWRDFNVQRLLVLVIWHHEVGCNNSTKMLPHTSCGQNVMWLFIPILFIHFILGNNMH